MGSIVAYIDARYAKKKIIKGDVVQISMREFDYSHEFARLPHGERRAMAIRHELQAKAAVKRQPYGARLVAQGLFTARKKDKSSTSKTSTDSTKTHRTVMAEGIIIGYARPDSCRDPLNPSAVRASISKVGAAVAYIPAEQSLRRFT